jgi:hypothetical protein
MNQVRYEYESEDCNDPSAPFDAKNGEVWNPQYNSDYFDIDEVDEYGDEEEEDEEIETLVYRRKELRLDNLRYCPECGGKAKINTPFPYCEECGWDSLVDQRRSFNEWNE